MGKSFLSSCCLWHCMRSSDYFAAPVGPSLQLHSSRSGVALYQGVSETSLVQSKKRFCRPWGRDFAWFLAYELCRASVQNRYYGVFSVCFRMVGGRASQAPTDYPQPFVGACPGWHPSHGVCQLEQVGSAGRQSGCSGQTTAQPVMQKCLCFSLCWWGLRLPECRSGQSSPPCLCVTPADCNALSRSVLQDSTSLF